MSLMPLHPPPERLVDHDLLLLIAVGFGSKVAVFAVMAAVMWWRTRRPTGLGTGLILFFVSIVLMDIPLAITYGIFWAKHGGWGDTAEWFRWSCRVGIALSIPVTILCGVYIMFKVLRPDPPEVDPLGVEVLALRKSKDAMERRIWTIEAENRALRAMLKVGDP